MGVAQGILGLIPSRSTFRHTQACSLGGGMGVQRMHIAGVKNGNLRFRALSVDSYIPAGQKGVELQPYWPDELADLGHTNFDECDLALVHFALPKVPGTWASLTAPVLTGVHYRHQQSRALHPHSTDLPGDHVGVMLRKLRTGASHFALLAFSLSFGEPRICLRASRR